MSRDPLQVISKLRRIALDNAKQVFAATLAEEARARHQVKLTEALIQQEGKIAANVSTGDDVVEAYAAWLPKIRDQARADGAACDEATANVLLARAALNIAHAAAEIVITLQNQQATEVELMLSRKSQAEMDEIGARVTASNSRDVEP